MLKDHFRCGKLSTSYIEVNVDWVKQVMSSNRWFTVGVITSQLNFKKKNSFEVSQFKFGLVKYLLENNSKCFEWWSGAPDASVSGHHRVSSNYTKLATTRKPNAPGWSLEISDVAEAEENKIDKDSYIDHIHRWLEHRRLRVLDTEFDDQYSGLLRDDASYGYSLACVKRQRLWQEKSWLFTATMYLLTTPCVSSSSWLRWTSLHLKNLAIHQILLWITFSFPQAQWDH